MEVLEDGYDCSPSKRQQAVVERCIRKGNKEYKAVLAKTDVTYPDRFVEQVWRLIHFSKISYNKYRRRAQ